MSSGGVNSQTLDGGYFIAAATVLCCYEHLLTAHNELKLVWGRRLSAGSVLFILNRYAILAVSLASIAGILFWPAVGVSSGLLADYSMTCQIAVGIADIGIIVVFTAYAAFAALRMYALYNMNKYIFVSVLFAGILGPCGQSFLMASEYTTQGVLIADTQDVVGWEAIARTHEGHHTKWLPHGRFFIAKILIALRAHAVVFEAILLGLTWNKTMTCRSLRGSEFRTPFTTVLLRDGTLYFLAIAAASSLCLGGMVTISTDLVAESAFVEGLGLISPMVDTITSICMSRFLLALFAAAEGERDSQYRSSRWDSIVRFAQVETLGAQLRDVPEEGFEEGEGGDVRLDPLDCTPEADVGELELTA